MIAIWANNILSEGDTKIQIGSKVQLTFHGQVTFSWLISYIPSGRKEWHAPLQQDEMELAETRTAEQFSGSRMVQAKMQSLQASGRSSRIPPRSADHRRSRSRKAFFDARD
jgi:hypothetical protein